MIKLVRVASSSPPLIHPLESLCFHDEDVDLLCLWDQLYSIQSSSFFAIPLFPRRFLVPYAHQEILHGGKFDILLIIHTIEWIWIKDSEVNLLKSNMRPEERHRITFLILFYRQRGTFLDHFYPLHVPMDGICCC
jgi:hypothetical protein